MNNDCKSGGVVAPASAHQSCETLRAHQSCETLRAHQSRETLRAHQSRETLRAHQSRETLPAHQSRAALSAQLELQLKREMAGRRQPTEAELRALSRGTVPSSAYKPQARREAARRSRGCDAEARRRRALNAMRGLPHRLSTDIRFTDAFFIVLDFHYRYADEHGCHKISLPEISNRLKLSRSTIIRAHRLLESESLLVVSRCRLAVDMNDTNVYELGEELMKGRPAALKEDTPSPQQSGRVPSESVTKHNPNSSFSGVSGGGVRDETPKENSIYSNSTTPQKPRSERSEELCADRLTPALGGNAYSVLESTLSPRKRDKCEISASPPHTGQLKLLQQVSRILDPEQVLPGSGTVCHEKDRDLSPDDLLEQAEYLITQEIPLLYAPLWRMGLKRHGFSAVVAVFETVLLTRTDYVHTPHGYLWGILRKPRGQIAPEISMSRFLMQRRLPKALRLVSEGGPAVAGIDSTAWQERTRNG